MLSKISSSLHALTRGWLVLLLLAGFVVYIALTLPALQAAPGGDIVSLDARLYYTPQEAFATITSYGTARQLWILVYLTWDLINPLFYTLLFSLLISWLLQRIFSPGSFWQKLNLIPLGAGLADICENLSIVILLAAYPAQLTIVAWLSAIFTLSKITFLGVSVLVILLGIGGAAMHGFKKQTEQS